MPVTEFETIYTGNATQFVATHEKVTALQEEFVKSSKAAADSFSSAKSVTAYKEIEGAAAKAATVQTAASAKVKEAQIAATATVKAAQLQSDAAIKASDTQLESTKLRSASRIKAAKLAANAEIVASENAAASKIEATQLRIEASEKASLARREAAQLRAQQRASSWSAKGRAIGTVGSAMTMGVTLPGAAIIGYSMKAAMDFEQELATVQRLTGLSGASLDAFGEKLKKLSEQIPHSAKELADTAGLSAQMGVPADQLVSWTEMVMRLKDTSKGLKDVNELVMDTTKFMQAMGILKTAENLKNIGSILISLQPVGATTEGEILSLAQASAGLGHAMGLTAPQILAWSNALAAVGVHSESGATSIGRVMISIDKSVRSGSKQLQLFAHLSSMTAKQFTEAWKTAPSQTMAAIIDGLSGLKKAGGDVEGALGTMSNRGGAAAIRMMSNLLPLINNAGGASDALRQSLDHASTAQNKQNDIVAKSAPVYATTESKMKILRDQAENIAITLGGDFNQAFKDAAPLIKDVLNKVDDAVKAFSKMPPEQKKVVEEFALLAFAIGPMATLTSKVIGLYGALAKLTGLAIGDGAFGGFLKALGVGAGGAAAGLFLAGNSGGTDEYDSIHAYERAQQNAADKAAGRSQTFGALPPMDAKGIKDKHDRTLAEYYLSIRNNQPYAAALGGLEKSMAQSPDGTFNYGPPFGNVYPKDYFAGKKIEEAYQKTLRPASTEHYGPFSPDVANNPAFNLRSARGGGLAPGTIIKDDGTIVPPSALSRIPYLSDFSGSIGPGGSRGDSAFVNKIAGDMAKPPKKHKKTDAEKDAEEIKQRIEDQRREVAANKTPLEADKYSLTTYGVPYSKLPKGSDKRKDVGLHTDITNSDAMDKANEGWEKFWEKAVEYADKQREKAEKSAESVDKANDSWLKIFDKAAEEGTKLNDKAKEKADKAVEEWDKAFTKGYESGEKLQEKQAEDWSKYLEKSTEAAQKLYDEKLKTYEDKVKAFSSDLTGSFMQVVEHVEVHGGHGLGKDIGQTANQFARNQGNKFLSDKLQGGLEKVTGGLFGGKPKDPVAAQNLNTSWLEKNTQALIQLINSLTGGSGYDGTGLPGVPGLPGLGIPSIIGSGGGPLGNGGGGLLSSLFGLAGGAGAGVSGSAVAAALPGVGILGASDRPHVTNNTTTVNHNYTTPRTQNARTDAQAAANTHKSIKRVIGKAG